MKDHIPKLNDKLASLSDNEVAVTHAQVTTARQEHTDEGTTLFRKIKAAKEKIRGVFPSIECKNIESGFNTVLVYALLELASEEGKDDGWFQEAVNETMWDRHNSQQ